MAAYAALVCLTRAIDQILPHDQDYAFLCGKKQMKSLHEKVVLLQELLEDISGQSHSSRIDDVQESRITCIAYQLEDVVESIICRSLGQEFESDVDKQEFFRCFEEVGVLLVEAMEMKKISLGNKDKAVQRYPTTTIETPSSAKDTEVGLGDDFIQILDRVTGQGSKLEIVPITGMGGIGKTTLARTIYENSRIVNYFDVRVWVTVSGEFRMEDILRRLLPDKQQTEVHDERLVEFVHKRLIGRRFLIVLDDTWHNEVWDGVRRAFPNDNNGSRVILTTRLLGVANYVRASSPVHEMNLLNEDKSWALLLEKVYEHEICPTEFEDIGRTISRNCKGLPLALVVIAGILKFNKTKDYWKEVAKNTNAEAASTEYEKLFGILSLSYANLPPHLKACFLYVGAFPEDYEIPTKELAMLWTAEGFLKPKGSKKMEDVAEECLEELVERSLFLVTKRGYNGKIKTLNVHDVLREVSIRKAQEEKFLHNFMAEDLDEVSFRKIIEVQRRLNFSTHKLFNFPYDNYDAFARSVLIKYPMNSGWLSIILHIKLLRVLDRVHIQDASRLSTLFKLTNLRYLHFVIDDYPPLIVPESISNLQNLETLIVSGKYRCELRLPLEIWMMPRLRHLVLTRRCDLPFPVLNQGYPILESLHTLSWVTNFDFNESVAVKIPNIKKLSLEYKVSTKNDTMIYFHFVDLVHLHRLEELAVCGETSRPQNYAFPLNLKMLTLEQTKIPWRNMSIVGSLPNLEKLTLKWYSVTGREWVPNKGEFVRLKYLKMEKLLIYDWRAESAHFPCLETLIIVSCITLNEVPSEIGEIETLKKLILKNCKPARESVEAIQEEQLDYGNTGPQVNISYDAYVPDLLYDPDDPDLWL